MKPCTSPTVSSSCGFTDSNDTSHSSCKCYQCRDIETPTSSPPPATRGSPENNVKKRAEVLPFSKKFIIYVHFLSVFSCLTLLVQSTLVGATTTTTITTKNGLDLEDIGGYQPKLEDPGGVDEEAFLQKYSDQISIRVNPLLRHRRQPYARRIDHQMCHVWTRNSPRDLCNKGRWARLRQLRELSVFSKDCSDESTNIQLGELFRLEWTKIKSEEDLLSYTEHLKDGFEGRDCITAAPKSDQCLRCFNKIDQAFEVMDKAYDAFNRTLRRFDCMLAVDISSATRPFSPNGTCEDCKKWYRRWLLVQLVDIWKETPCINWCYYAQLACPHLAPSRQVDYAGHPSFLCRDRKISYSPVEEVSSCSCFHPCDIMRTRPEPSGWFDKNRNRASVRYGYDFFASDEHCWARNRRCTAERELLEQAIDGNRLPRTKAPPISDPESNSLPDMSNTANNGNKLSGYIQDQPEELFNQLGAWFFPTTNLHGSPPTKTNQLEPLAVQHRHQHNNNNNNKRLQPQSPPLSRDFSSSSSSNSPKSFTLLVITLSFVSFWCL